MAKAAQNEELKVAFEKHRGETEGQVERLEEVFAIIEQGLRIDWPARGICMRAERRYAKHVDVPSTAMKSP